MKVCVLGLGYVGFPSACLIAQAGHETVGVDVNPRLLGLLAEGNNPIRGEEGLDELFREVHRSKRLRLASAPEAADVFVIAVPTPFRHDALPTGGPDRGAPLELEYTADLSYVDSAARALAPFIRAGNLVVLESTVPAGTTARLAELLHEAGVDTRDLLFAHAPERVLPGNVVHELVYNDRIVGGLTPEATAATQRFYQTFVQGQVVATDATTAELAKLMENTFRDVNIALANEFALVAESLGVDVWEAIRLANRHPRVNVLRPGPGVGGHCIAVDPYFVVEAAPDVTPLIQTARRVNRGMPGHVLQLLDRLAEGAPVRRVAVLGASYKANVGDERESPALEIVGMLQERGVDVEVHDPYIRRYDKPIADVVAGADAILLLTEHRVYQEIAPAQIAPLVSRKLVLDTRGHLNRASWTTAGFTFAQLGVGEFPKTVPSTGDRMGQVV